MADIKSKQERDWEDRRGKMFHVKIGEVNNLDNMRFYLELEFIELNETLDAEITLLNEFPYHKEDDESICFECGNPNPTHKIADGVVLCDDCYNNDYGDYE